MIDMTLKEWPKHTELKFDIKDDRKPEAKRKATMKACGCKLCFLCLNPPTTFALYESYGLDKIWQEQKRLPCFNGQAFKGITTTVTGAAYPRGRRTREDFGDLKYYRDD